MKHRREYRIGARQDRVEQAQRLFEATEGGAIPRSMGATGDDRARLGEAMGLKWSDIELERASWK